MCPAMRSSVQLLLQSLSPPPLLVAQASSLLDQLTNCTRDLHRGGGIEVRDNGEVWRDLVCSIEGIVSTVMQCIEFWIQKCQAELHNSLNVAKQLLGKFRRDAQTIVKNKNEVHVSVMEVVQKISGALNEMHQWKSFIPDQRKQVLNVWLKQLHTGIQLFPRVAVLMVSLHQNCANETKVPSPSFISFNIVVARIEEVIDEIVTATSLKFDVFAKNSAAYEPGPAPGAFLTAVDKVLELLSSAAARPHTDTLGEQNTSIVAARDISNAPKSITVETSSLARLSSNDENKNGPHKSKFLSCDRSSNSSGKSRNTYDPSYECSTVTTTGVTSAILPSHDETPPLGQVLKVPLEEILRHVISIAYCSSPSDNKAIMSLCEEVLAHLKQLVNMESSESGSSGHIVEHTVACECLAESVERLEQRAHTALIRCYVRTFADVALPIDRLLHALQSVCSSTPEQSPSSTLPLMQERIADLDEHVDVIFQLAALAAASSVEQSRSCSVRSCLLTLEWLESVLVPVLLQPCSRLPARAATPCLQKHAQLLADHWKDAAVALQQCLDASLDPAAFVMVTQSEVHAAWWHLKQKLYSQDLSAVEEPVTRVLAMTARLSHLHQTDAFMTYEQIEHLSRATNEVQRSMKAVSSAPENLRMRRSLLKRVQLMLTVVTKLSSSLHSSTLQDNTVLRHAMRPNLLGRSVVQSPGTPHDTVQDSGDRNWMATSDIGDIPLDVATPFRNIPRSSLRCTNPCPDKPRSIGEEAPTPSPAESFHVKLISGDASHRSSDDEQLDVQEGPDSAMTTCVASRVNNVSRPISKCGNTASFEHKANTLSPSEATPVSSSILPDSVVKETDDQLRNLSAVLVNEALSEDMSVASSMKLNRDNSYAVSSSTKDTNFDHLKGANLTLESVCDDTTLDITRLLASNTLDPALRSSIRASMRSQLLRNLRGKHQSPVVKAVNVDLSAFVSPATASNRAVTDASKLPPRPLKVASRCGFAVQPSGDTDVTSGSRDAECVQLQEETDACAFGDAADPGVQGCQSGMLVESNSLVQEITDLMENLSTFASHFSSCKTVGRIQSSDVSDQKWSASISEETSGKCITESSVLSNCDEHASGLCQSSRNEKLDSNLVNNEVLRGIRLHGVSFSPQFLLSDFSRESNDASIFGSELSDKENISVDATGLSNDCPVTEKMPLGKEMVDLTETTSPTQIETSIIHETEKKLYDQKALPDVFEWVLSSEKISRVSSSVIDVNAAEQKRSPLRDLNTAASKTHSDLSTSDVPVNENDSSSAKDDAEASRQYKRASFKSSVASIATPDSVDVNTPQRLLDIHILRNKLCKLKSRFRL